MRPPAIVSLLIFAASLALNCNLTRGQEGETHSSNVAAVVKQIFRSRCVECHGENRSEAGLDLFDRDSLVGDGTPVIPSDVGQSVLFDYVASDDEDFRMPPAPRSPLSKIEIEAIRTWIAAGAPAFPDDVSPPQATRLDPANTSISESEYVLSRIAQFLHRTPREDRPFLRFFSSSHLVSGGVTQDALETQRRALAKAINHLSWQSEIVHPIEVDAEDGTILAVDIRKLGWHRNPLVPIKATHPNAFTTQKSSVKFDFFDLILLEYPYGLTYENSEAFDELRHLLIEPAQLIRPIPFLRIDWFVCNALQSPLYEDLLQLPHQLEDLEKLIGVDSANNLKTFIAKRGGMTLSGVSQNNRVVERHPAKYGAYWKSFDFESSKGRQNMFTDPLNFHFAGGEMIWNLPNGLQAYMVTDAAGNRILEAPTSIVTDKFAEDKTVRNGLSCIRCHDRGMKRFADNIRPAFVSLPDSQKVNRTDVLKLYPEKADMDTLLENDESRFVTSLEKVIGRSQGIEPLVTVSRQFLEAPLSIKHVSGELGLVDTTGLQAIFRLPQFTRLGLAGLSSGNVVRRDAWEDHFGPIAAAMGIGTPILAIDGNTTLDKSSSEESSHLKIMTNHPNGIYSPGDEMVVTITNESTKALFIEMVGTSSLGFKVHLTDGVVLLKANEVLRFPQSGSIKIKPQLGTEFITVFANTKTFPPGLILRGENIADRLIHDLYRFEDNSDRVNDVENTFIKRTLKIETK